MNKSKELKIQDLLDKADIYLQRFEGKDGLEKAEEIIPILKPLVISYYGLVTFGKFWMQSMMLTISGFIFLSWLVAAIIIPSALGISLVFAGFSIKSMFSKLRKLDAEFIFNQVPKIRSELIELKVKEENELA